GSSLGSPLSVPGCMPDAGSGAQELQIPSVRPGPAVGLELALQLQLASQQRLLIGKRLDPLRAVGLADDQLVGARRGLACLVADEFRVAPKPGEHRYNDAVNNCNAA